MVVFVPHNIPLHSLTVIPVNTGQMQGLIAQQTDLIDSFGLDSPQ
jgi:hypothetical protein